MPDLTNLGLAATIPVFLVSAVLVWLAGVRISRYASVISDETGIEQSLIGLLLLGGVTSLPELAVALSASIGGAPDLAVNSMLGGIAMQVAILGVADALLGRRALTSVLPDPTVLLQGALGVLLLSIVAAGIIVGDTPVLGTGLWMWLLAGATVTSFWILVRSRGRKPWIVNDPDGKVQEEKARAEEEAKTSEHGPLRRVVVKTVVAGLVIVAAGTALSQSGEAIAEQTGLGQSFVGAVLVAISTSLPEMSTVYSAMRAGLYTMAVSDIFGTNLFDISFLFLIDLAGGGGAVLNELGRFSTFAALIGITVTATYMVGIAERRDRTVLRMGVDSIGVLVIYVGGLVVLYFLR